MRPRNERSRPRAEGDPEKHTDNAIISEGCDTAREMYSRRRWERHWRRQLEFDLYEIALATAEVDNLDRRVPSPFDISFAEARALAAVHGVSCACHPAPEPPPAQHQSRGAA